jgi:hypothetical protein
MNIIKFISNSARIYIENDNIQFFCTISAVLSYFKLVTVIQVNQLNS